MFFQRHTKQLVLVTKGRVAKPTCHEHFTFALCSSVFPLYMYFSVINLWLLLLGQYNMIRIRFLITFIFPKIDVKWHQSATFLNCPPKYPDFGSRSSATINEYATPYVTLHAFPKVKKPSIFTYRKACHYQVISDLPQKRKGI